MDYNFTSSEDEESNDSPVKETHPRKSDVQEDNADDDDLDKELNYLQQLKQKIQANSKTKMDLKQSY
jgi:hypothetical protein